MPPQKSPPLILMIVMMMAPQILETLYSPALTSIRHDFSITASNASQTLSIYFIAFALGVLIWGFMADHMGRRLAMLSGLSIYVVGATMALLAQNFFFLMLARFIVAFGAAVGSIITQTMMRDSYSGAELGKVFSIMGMALAISPIIGMISGGLLVEHFGNMGVFSGQLWFALVLFLWCSLQLPETKTTQQSIPPSITSIARSMLRDKQLWGACLLITLFNIMVFSYYSLSPFIFETLGWHPRSYGYSGIVLALGSLMGALMNRILLAKMVAANRQIFIAIIITLIAALLMVFLQKSLGFLMASGLVMLAFGLAIPNILSQALVNYQYALGTAGALFGLFYYLFIGLGMALSATLQNLPLTLMLCSGLCFSVFLYLKK